MSAILGSLKVKLAYAIVSAGVALPVTVGFAFAEAQATADQIINALKSAETTTRGLTASPAAAANKAEEARFLDSLRNRPTRSLTVAERDKIASVAENKPSIDLEINFEYNSDAIGANALPQVTALGQALSRPELKGGTFMIGGYTDAKGSEAFNKKLSERRSDALKRYLADEYHVDAANLVTVGYGKTRLKNPSNPMAAENRRVQLVNVADK
jgi:outer membrane protein OmpA-like peptidoglycan-associated protein